MAVSQSAAGLALARGEGAPLKTTRSGPSAARAAFTEALRFDRASLRPTASAAGARRAPLRPTASAAPARRA